MDSWYSLDYLEGGSKISLGLVLNPMESSSPQAIAMREKNMPTDWYQSKLFPRRTSKISVWSPLKYDKEIKNLHELVLEV